MPDIFPDLVPYWKAFKELNTSRSMGGFGAGYIPLSEIILWLDENGIDGFEDRLDYIRWVQFNDSEYIEIQHQKQKDKAKSKPKPQVRGRRR